MRLSTRRSIASVGLAFALLIFGTGQVRAEVEKRFIEPQDPTEEWPRWASSSIVDVPSPEGRLHLIGGRALEVQFLIDDAIQELPPGFEPTAMVVGDLDSDGIDDLVVGGAFGQNGVAIIYRGNRRALHPPPVDPNWSWHTRPPHSLPFHSPARVITLAARPDMMAIADLDRDGFLDLVVATNRAESLALHRGDGRGGLSEGDLVRFGCRVTALAAGALGPTTGRPLVAVGLENDEVHSVELLRFSHGRLRVSAQAWRAPAGVRRLEFLAIASNRGNDLAVIAGHELLVVRGGAQRADALEPVAIPIGANAIVVGDFLREEPVRLEIAALDPYGDLHIFRADAEWKVAERASLNLFDANGLDGDGVNLLRARMSSSFIESVIAVDSTRRDLRLVEPGTAVANQLASANTRVGVPRLPSALSTQANSAAMLEATAPKGSVTAQSPIEITSGRLAIDRVPLAIASMRLGPDALRDLVLLVSGQPYPVVVRAMAAETVSVTTTSDLKDGDTSSIQALISDPGTDGLISLREAIEAANSTPGLDSIHFDITGCDVTTGVCTISPAGNGLPRIREAVVLDGTTQTGYVDTPLIHIDGSSADSTAPGLAVTGGGSTVRGLAFNGFSGNSDIVAWFAGGNVIEGCFFGTDPAGAAVVGSVNGVHLSGISGNTIGGTGVGAGNLFAGQTVAAVALTAGASGNSVEGNLIGSDAAETAALGYSGNGVMVHDAPANLIGGALESQKNLITGGSDANFPAIAIAGAGSTGNQITGNTVASNASVGVYLAGTAGDANLIVGNSLSDSGGLGIDLCASFDPVTGACTEADPVTLNDVLDADSGPNQLQNYPVLQAGSPRTSGERLLVAGTLDSAADETFTVDVYASTACDPSGYGEGTVHVGSFAVTTDGAGVAIFDETIAATLAGGLLITTTATDAAGNTSELSACEPVAAVTDIELAVTATPDPAVPDGSLTYELTVTNLSTIEQATGVVVNATLPGKVTLVDADGCVAEELTVCGCATTITCDLGTLLPEAAATRTLQTTVKSTALGIIASPFDAVCDQTELTTDNNAVTVETLVDDLLLASSPGNVISQANDTGTKQLTVGQLVRAEVRR